MIDWLIDWLICSVGWLTYRSYQQLLLLWDRIFAYDSMELLAGVFIASCIAWESESLVADSCNSDKLSCYIRTFQKTKTFLIFHSYHLEFKPAAFCNFLYSQDWTHCQSALHSLQTITCCNLYSQINAILFSIQWAGLHHFPFVFILRSSFRVAPHYWDGTSISGEFLKYQSIFKLLSWQRACLVKQRFSEWTKEGAVFAMQTDLAFAWLEWSRVLNRLSQLQQRV